MMKKKHVIAKLLVFAMLLSMLPLSAVAADPAVTRAAGDYALIKDVTIGEVTKEPTANKGTGVENSPYEVAFDAVTPTNGKVEITFNVEPEGAKVYKVASDTALTVENNKGTYTVPETIPEQVTVKVYVQKDTATAYYNVTFSVAAEVEEETVITPNITTSADTATVNGETVDVVAVEDDAVVDALEQAKTTINSEENEIKTVTVKIDVKDQTVNAVKLNNAVFEKADEVNDSDETEVKVAVVLPQGTVTLNKAAIKTISGSEGEGVVMSFEATTEDAITAEKKPLPTLTTGTIKAVFEVNITVGGNKVVWDKTKTDNIIKLTVSCEGLPEDTDDVKVYLDDEYADGAKVTELEDVDGFEFPVYDIEVPHLTIVSLVEGEPDPTTPSGGGSTGGGGGGGGSSKPSIKPGETQTPNAPTAPTAGVAGFYDVAVGSWYAEYVQYVVDKGLFDGVGNGNFAPNANMTRAMMWTVLARYMGVDTKTNNGNWYEAARAWAIAQGISDGTMATSNVTREQFVTMLWRLSGEPAAPSSASFTDNGSVSAYAKTAVDWAVAQGIVNGYSDGSFKPQGSATRAEVAKMLTVFCTNAENAPAETTPAETTPEETTPEETTPAETTPTETTPEDTSGDVG